MGSRLRKRISKRYERASDALNPLTDVFYGLLAVVSIVAVLLWPFDLPQFEAQWMDQTVSVFRALGVSMLVIAPIALLITLRK